MIRWKIVSIILIIFQLSSCEFSGDKKLEKLVLEKNNEILRTLIINSGLVFYSNSNQTPRDIFQEISMVQKKTVANFIVYEYLYDVFLHPYYIYILRNTNGELISTYVHKDEIHIYSSKNKLLPNELSSFEAKLSFEPFLKDCIYYLEPNKKKINKKLLIKIIEDVIGLRLMHKAEIVSTIGYIPNLGISINEKKQMLNTLNSLLPDLDTPNVFYFHPKNGEFAYWKLTFTSPNTFKLNFIGRDSYFRMFH